MRKHKYKKYGKRMKAKKVSLKNNNCFFLDCFTSAENELLQYLSKLCQSAKSYQKM